MEKKRPKQIQIKQERVHLQTIIEKNQQEIKQVKYYSNFVNSYMSYDILLFYEFFVFRLNMMLLHIQQLLKIYNVILIKLVNNMKKLLNY